MLLFFGGKKKEEKNKKRKKKIQGNCFLKESKKIKKKAEVNKKRCHHDVLGVDRKNRKTGICIMDKRRNLFLVFNLRNLFIFRPAIACFQTFILPVKLSLPLL